MSESTPVQGLLLRLQEPLLAQAIEAAHSKSTTLNFFIGEAVAERIARIHLPPPNEGSPQPVAGEVSPALSSEEPGS